MSKTKGMSVRIEDWIVTVLAALKDNEGVDVFKTVQPYIGQLDEKGIEGILGLQPFAFVAYFPFSPQREGDYDLNDKLRFSVLIGIESKEAGVARRGDDAHLGASQIRDLVITAIEKKHPGEGFDCDEFYYDSETEWVDSPKKYATELFFVANWLRS
jgi:hypothetical protein